nr:TRAP transporter small permease [Pseudoxanthomonas sp.]
MDRAAIALVGLVLVQSWQVFTRYVLNDSPSWTEPVTLLLLATAMG